jgi:hypothetical protein
VFRLVVPLIPPAIKIFPDVVELPDVGSWVAECSLRAPVKDAVLLHVPVVLS